MANEPIKLTWATYRRDVQDLQASLLDYGNKLDGFLGLFGRPNDSRVRFSAASAVEIDGLPLAEVEALVSNYESSSRLLRFYHRFVRPLYPIKKRSALLLYAQSKLLLGEVIALESQPSVAALEAYDARFRVLSRQTQRLSFWSSLRDYGRSLRGFVRFWGNSPHQITEAAVIPENIPLLSSHTDCTYGAMASQLSQPILPANESSIENDARIVVHPRAHEITVSQHEASPTTDAAKDELALRIIFEASTGRLIALLTQLDGLEDEDAATAEARLSSLYEEVEKEAHQMRKHYKTLCLRYHPDKLGEGASHDAFTQLMSVYDTELADFKKNADFCKDLAKIKKNSAMITRELNFLLDSSREMSQALTKVDDELQETRGELQDVKVKLDILMEWHKEEKSQKKDAEVVTTQKYNGPGVF